MKSLRLKEAIWEADQRIAELSKKAAKGDKQALEELLRLALCQRTS